jgi:DNA-binding transcriptional ArsR family regulator
MKHAMEDTDRIVVPNFIEVVGAQLAALGDAQGRSRRRRLSATKRSGHTVSAQRTVLSALGDLRVGDCASIGQLRRSTGLSGPTLARTLRFLANAGLIERVATQRDRVRYRLASGVIPPLVRR